MGGGAEGGGALNGGERMRTKGYYLMTVIPVQRLNSMLRGKKPIKVTDSVTIYTELNRKEKERRTLIIDNRGGQDFLLISNSTFITKVKDFTRQITYFLMHKKEVEEALSASRNWNTKYIVTYFEGEPFNVVVLRYRGGLSLLEEELQRLIELYLGGELDGIKMHNTLPAGLTEYGRKELYLIETHEEQSVTGLTRTLYALFLAR